MTNPIDKKVYRIVNDKMITNIVYTIVEVIDFEKSKDWCLHYIIKSDKGNTIEVREVDVVFIPNDKLSEDEKICQFLKDNECYTDEVYSNGIVVAIRIDGDWKHSHGWCKVLMGYLGYTFQGEQVTEEDGSDWYESIHYYKKTK